MKNKTNLKRLLTAAIAAALLWQCLPAVRARATVDPTAEILLPETTAKQPEAAAEQPETGDALPVTGPEQPEAGTEQPTAAPEEPETGEAPEPADWTEGICAVPDGDGGTEVRLQWVDDTAWLFLPAAAELRRLELAFDCAALTVAAGGRSVTVESGTAFDLTALVPEADSSGVYELSLTAEGRTVPLRIMRSANIASVYLTSADPAKDRRWVEQSKSNKAKGSAVVLDEAGAVLYRGGLKQIKGRGNSSWDSPKKPYQIKLDAAADLMETGLEAEASKTWILLANYCDPTLLRNQVSFTLADAMGLDYTPHCRPVDLYYDGVYRGSYLLCEKTEVGPGRVEIADLEKEIEAANSAVTDFDALATVQGQTPAGQPCQYVDGLETPEELRGGYLLELDFAERAKAEKSWFLSGLGKYVVCKSPEYLSKACMDHISALWQEFEDAIVAGGVNPDTGRSYDEIMDLDSLVRCYLLEELSRDCDAFQSSAFFYKDVDEEKLYAGPVWDFDSAYDGQGSGAKPALAAGATKLGRHLLKIPGFREAVQSCYETVLKAPLETLVDQGMTEAYEMLRASQRMDHVLWPEAAPADYAAAAEGLRTFLRQRHSWLYEEVMGWTADAVPYIGFGDVDPDAWYARAVDCVVGAGLFQGVSEMNFAPEGSMTRAMIVTVLYRLAGSPPTEWSPQFTDVPAGKWYSEAVCWAAENGIALGDQGRFRPTGEVTLQELLAFVHRFAGEDAEDAETAEDAEAEETAEAVEAVEDTEAVETVEDAEAAEAVEDTEAAEPEAEPLTGPETGDAAQETAPETAPEPDPAAEYIAQASNWAAEDVAWAVRVGIIPALADGRAPKETALRCHAAVAFQRLLSLLEDTK